MTWLSESEFFRMLRRRTARTAARIDAKIQARGARDLTILMCDSSGFSRRTHQYGILQFLAVMTQCYERLMPLVRRHRGETISHAADNLLAVFGNPADAVRAGRAMHAWLRKRNEKLEDPDRFHLCIGVHCGPVIRLRENVYGAAVNVAAKIGEDFAGKDEILATKDVVDRLPATVERAYNRSVTVGGISFELYQIR